RSRQLRADAGAAPPSDRPGAALGRPGIHPHEPDAERDDVLDDRYRGHAAALGHSTGALPAHIHPDLRAAADSASFVDGPGIADGRGRARPRPEYLVSGAADLSSPSSGGLLPGRDGLSWRARAASSSAGALDRILPGDVLRRGPGRPFQRSPRPAGLRPDRGISSGARPGLSRIAENADRFPRTLEPLAGLAPSALPRDSHVGPGHGPATPFRITAGRLSRQARLWTRRPGLLCIQGSPGSIWPGVGRDLAGRRDQHQLLRPGAVPAPELLRSPARRVRRLGKLQSAGPWPHAPWPAVPRPGAAPRAAVLFPPHRADRPGLRGLARAKPGIGRGPCGSGSRDTGSLWRARPAHDFF